MSTKDHWQDVYNKKTPGEVSWYRPHLDRSLEFIRSSELQPDARIIVGGGASTLVDDLLEDGYRNVAVIDLADAALAAALTVGVLSCSLTSTKNALAGSRERNAPLFICASRNAVMVRSPPSGPPGCLSPGPRVMSPAAENRVHRAEKAQTRAHGDKTKKAPEVCLPEPLVARVGFEPTTFGL